jgi:hypothetical protein
VPHESHRIPPGQARFHRRVGFPYIPATGPAGSVGCGEVYPKRSVEAVHRRNAERNDYALGFCNMLTRIAIVGIVAMLVSGCASETVKLQNPTTGVSVTCGPCSYWPSIILAEIRLRDCVKDYQLGGYNRTP